MDSTVGAGDAYGAGSPAAGILATINAERARHQAADVTWSHELSDLTQVCELLNLPQQLKARRS